MGYTTEFDGAFTITPTLSVEHYAELRDLAEQGRTEMPTGAPDAYLQWEPSRDGSCLRWDGGEKFYCYDEWLRWLIAEWFAPRGYILSGEVKYQGEHIGDCGVLRVHEGGVIKTPARFDETHEAALREIIRRYEADSLDVEDAVDLARAALSDTGRR